VAQAALRIEHVDLHEGPGLALRAAEMHLEAGKIEAARTQRLQKALAVGLACATALRLVDVAQGQLTLERGVTAR
jgi:hypothetical protein